MKTIRIIKDWDKTGDLIGQTPNGDGIWGDYQFTEDEIDECEAVVILNRPKKNLEIRTKQVLIIQMEPPTPAHTWYKDSYKYADLVLSQYADNRPNHLVLNQGGLPWHSQKNYDELAKGEFSLSNKLHKISMITSNANWMKGHEYRLNLVKYLQDQHFNFDLFGRGFHFVEDKWDAHFPYQYSLVIENSFYPHYWTEKLSDALLAFTIPVYIGAPNILDYFPEKSIINISPTSFSSVKEQLVDILENDSYEARLDDVKKARELILNNYQLFPLVTNALNGLPKDSPYKLRKIPKNIAPWEGRPLTIQRKIQYHCRKLFNLKPY